MSTALPPHLLLGYDGSGSAIVECAFALGGLPLRVETVDLAPGSATRERVLAYNPLAQVPVLLFPDGGVMTESLAILHYVQDIAPASGLIPTVNIFTRTAFYRWAVFLVAAVYPTFTYGDDPRQWVDDEAGAARLRQSTDQARMAHFEQLEAAAQTPYFLGEELSAIDLYLACMVYWRPRLAWFELEAPTLAAIARRVRMLPGLTPIFDRHYPLPSI